jgi:uncharacterized protein YecE (DUF72 family)
MEFGKVTNAELQNIVFELPALSKENLFFEQKNATNIPKIYVGCPIWANKNWVGKWYPQHTKPKDYLEYYAKQFNTIELNSTHYQIPSNQTIKNWKQKVPNDFKFCPKFPQEISHELLSKSALKTQEYTHYFCEMMQLFEENLGTSFLQLPPYFSPKEENKLIDFCEKLREKSNFDFSVEFRHEDWFKENNILKISKKLALLNVGTLITDTAGRRDAVHICLSNSIMMLRFVGNDLHISDFERVKKWISHIVALCQIDNEYENPISDLYFFAHEPNNDLAPDLAEFFISLLMIMLPHACPTAPEHFDNNKAEQGSLF